MYARSTSMQSERLREAPVGRLEPWQVRNRGGGDSNVTRACARRLKLNASVLRAPIASTQLIPVVRDAMMGGEHNTQNGSEKDFWVALTSGRHWLVNLSTVQWP